MTVLTILTGLAAVLTVLAVLTILTVLAALTAPNCFPDHVVQHPGTLTALTVATVLRVQAPRLVIEAKVYQVCLGPMGGGQ